MAALIASIQKLAKGTERLHVPNMPVISSISLLSDAKFFDEKNSKFAQLRENLDHKLPGKKLDAMKRLIAMMTLGRDVSSFFPDVVKNVIVDNTEIKKLVYMFLTHYAAENQELALLAINTLQKDLASSNQRVRANALRAMSSISIKVVIPLVMIALKNAVRDTSSYVRKAAACAIPKVFVTDPGKKPELVEMVAELLTNTEPNVLGATVFAFTRVCPKRFELLHPHFRKICTLLADFDSYGQVVTLGVLTRYARDQFRAPPGSRDQGNGQGVADGAFYSDDDDSSDAGASGAADGDAKPTETREMDADHKLLLKSASQLLNSEESSVVIAVSSLMFAIAPDSDARACAGAVVRHVSRRREVLYVVLANISSMASKRPEMFRPYFKMFFVYWDDPGFIRDLKLDILANLASESTVGPILAELFSYVNHPHAAFVSKSIRTIGRCAMANPHRAERCLHMLLVLVSGAKGDAPGAAAEGVVAQAIAVIRQLLQRDPGSHVGAIKRMAKLIETVNVPMARTALVWIVGEYREMIPKIAPDCLRMLAKTFRGEAVEVKLQILNLAVKLYQSNPKQCGLLFKYIMDLCKADLNFDIRDRARMVRSLFFVKKKSAGGSSELDRAIEDVQTKTKNAMKRCFLFPKPVPQTENPFKDREGLDLGTLSHVLQHPVSGYEVLPAHPDVAPDPSVREPKPEDDPEETATTSGKRRRKNKKKSSSRNGGSADKYKDFYGDVDGSGSSDSESSDSDSSSGSDSDSSDDSSSSGGSSDSSDSSGSDSDSDDRSGSREKPTDTRSSANGRSANGPSAAARDSSSGSDSGSSSSSGSDSDSTDDDNDDGKTPPNAQASSQPSRGVSGGSSNLLDELMGGGDVGTSAAAAQSPADAIAAAELLFGGAEAKGGSAESLCAPREGSQGVLLKGSMGGGLSADYAFLRQASSLSPRFAVIQLTLRASEDAKNVSMANISKEGGLETKAFDPIPIIRANSVTTTQVLVDFKGTERKLKFDLCAGSRQYTVSVGATPGDLVRGHILSAQEFEKSRKRMTGMQETEFQEKADSAEALASRVLRAANLLVLEPPKTGPAVLRLVGKQIADGQLVLVTVTPSETAGEFSVRVNCDDIMFSGTFAEFIREACQRK